MAQDIGTLLIRISADISALKTGVAQAQAEINKLKQAASGASSATSGWGAAFGRISDGFNTVAGQGASFLGTALSIYGALKLWQSALHGFYNVMSAAVSSVDDYKRAVASTAGMMTAITDKKFEPDLGAAYEKWKVYLDWLYRTSLETDRLVASGGREIFEAAKLMAIRGVVPTTKDQVYTVGLLSDFIKSVTQGLSERQQLLQEVRSMFEGQMRPGAQALAQFEAIIPGFRQKFEEARKAAMAMGDAKPIFDLLRSGLEGMSYSAKDIAATFESLHSTATSAFQLLMLEAFEPMYTKIVAMGWGLLDLYYKNGKLTDEGKRMAAALSVAWETVRVKIQEWVDILTKNPEKATEMLERVMRFLGEAANLALSLAKALETVVSAVGSITSGNIDVLAAALGAAALAALTLGKNIRWAMAAMGAGMILGEGLNELNEKTKTFSAKVQTAEKYLKPGQKDALQAQFPASTIDTLKEGAGKLWAGIQGEETEAGVTGKKYGESVLKQASKNIEEDSVHYRDILRTEGQKNKEGVSAFFTQSYLAIAQDASLSAQEKLIKQAAMRKAFAGLELTEGAPDVPRTTGGPPIKEKKGKGGGAGTDEQLAGLMKQLDEARRAFDLADITEKIKTVRAEFKKNAEQIKNDWKEGKISADEYFSRLFKNLEDESKFEKALINDKIAAAEKTYQAALKTNEVRVAEKELSPTAASILNDISRVKRDTEIVKAKGDLAQLEEKTAKDRLKIEEQILQLRLEGGKYLQQLNDDLRTGPVDAKEKQVEAEWRKYYEALDKGSIPRPGQSREVTTYGPEGKQVQTVSGDEIYAKQKLKEQEIRWGSYTREAADTIANGFSDMITALMDGSGDLKKTAQNIFKQLFNIAMKPGLEQLSQALGDAFKKMFETVGNQAGMAILGVIGMLGMMLLSGGSKSSFTPSGVQSQVTGHESVRGIIAGEDSIPIAQISVSLQEALLSTNSILSQIESNTRGIGQVQLNLTLDIPGIKDAVAKAIEQYFAEFAQTLGSR